MLCNCASVVEGTTSSIGSRKDDLGWVSKKGKSFPYLLPSVGPEAVQAVNPRVTISHPPGDRLPLLSARPAITFPAAEHHGP